MCGHFVTICYKNSFPFHKLWLSDNNWRHRIDQAGPFASRKIPKRKPIYPKKWTSQFTWQNLWKNNKNTNNFWNSIGIEQFRKNTITTTTNSTELKISFRKATFSYWSYTKNDVILYVHLFADCMDGWLDVGWLLLGIVSSDLSWTEAGTVDSSNLVTYFGCSVAQWKMMWGKFIKEVFKL